ncbi:hypothetical protein RHS03_00866, partial [Rhizoctonia solani]
MYTGELPPWDSSNFFFDGKGGATPPPTPPYHALLYTEGYQPYRIQFNNEGEQFEDSNGAIRERSLLDVDGEVNWVANLPLGFTFGVSMFDSNNYTGGVLERTLQMEPRAGCSVQNPLIPSTLDVEVTGKPEQCQMVVVDIKNGTSPYKLEITPKNGFQKTIRFEANQLGFVLDISAGMDYWLAVYDSAGHSAVKGSYKVLGSEYDDCLGVASTVRGQVSTLYPGGTTTFTPGTTATSGPHGLAKPAVIAISITVPMTVIVAIVLLTWFCYMRNRRDHRSKERTEIEPADSYHYTQYNPVPMGESSYTGSHNGIPNTGNHNPPTPTPYPLLPILVGNRSTIHAPEDTSTSEPSAVVLNEKRRHLINPGFEVTNADAQSSVEIGTELFGPTTLPGVSRANSELLPSPPIYSASY